MALTFVRNVAPACEVGVQAGSWVQPPQPISPPTAAYPGQDFNPLYNFISHDPTQVPSVQLKLGLIENATIIVQSGFDGLILDRSGAAVRETTFYTDVFRKNLNCIDLEVEGPVSELGDVVVAFDGSWWVYYHWLLFCLGSAGVANTHVASEAAVAVPDWSACAPNRPSAIPQRVFNEVKRVVDPGRLLRLSDGTYRAHRAYFLYVEGGQPSDVALHHLYRDVFQGLRSQAAPTPNARIFVSRAGRGGPARVTMSDEKLFDEVVVEYDVKTVRLEAMSFQTQIDLFASADLIISPHGSGLGNLVFASSFANVVELQTEFDAPGLVLPWFYILAAASGLDYAFLNREAGDFRAARLRDALSALGVSPPTSHSLQRSWRRSRRRIEMAIVQLRNRAINRLRVLWVRLIRTD